MKRFPLFALNIFGAILMSAAFAPWHLSFALPLAIQPLLTACRTSSTRGAALFTYAFFTVSILAVCHWIYAAAAGVLGAQYYGVALVVALYKAIPFACAGAASSVLYRRAPRYWIPGTAAFFTLAEWIDVSGNLALPFAMLSLSQLNTALTQPVAATFGALGVTFFVVAASCFISLAGARGLRTGAIAMSIVMIPYALTAVSHPSSVEPDRNVTVMLVQGRGLETLAALTMRDAASTDSAVVWSENALIARNEGQLDDQEMHLRAITRQLNLTLLTGSAGFSAAGLENRVLAVNPDGAIVEYRKRRLVPFGEYVPLRPVFAAVFPMLNGLGDFTRGSSAVDPLSADGKLRLRPLICYEGAFHDLLRGMRADEVAAVMTDGTWFRDPSGPLQQIDAMRMRAMERGTAALVVGTTGPSGTIDARGAWRAAMQAGEENARRVRVPANAPTWYGRSGDWPLLLLCMLWLGGLKVAASRREKAI